MEDTLQSTQDIHSQCEFNGFIWNCYQLKLKKSIEQDMRGKEVYSKLSECSGKTQMKWSIGLEG